MDLQTIQSIIAAPMQAFHEEYRAQLQSSVPIINSVNDYLTQRKGKMLRPLLTLLSAGAALNEVPDYKVKMAVAMEMLHNSSLIHDDVVDESNLRRGMETVNSRWSNQIAVLCGDFYLAKVMHLLCMFASSDERDIVSRTAIEMSEGELLQQQSSREFDLSEDQYMETIYKKTASLMASCCEVGAYGTTLLAHDGQSMAKALRMYGQLFGLAFQMRDDILDYSPQANTGKPCGNDIKEKKMTLPLIYFFRDADNDTQKYIRDILSQPAIGDDEAKQVVNMVNQSQALSLTHNKINEFTQKAIDQVSSLPASSYRDALINLTDLLVH